MATNLQQAIKRLRAHADQALDQRSRTDQYTARCIDIILAALVCEESKEDETIYVLTRQDVRDVLEQRQTDGEPDENFASVVLTEEHYRRAQKFVEADFADRWFEDIASALEEVESEKAGARLLPVKRLAVSKED